MQIFTKDHSISQLQHFKIIAFPISKHAFFLHFLYYHVFGEHAHAHIHFLPFLHQIRTKYFKVRNVSTKIQPDTSCYQFYIMFTMFVSRKTEISVLLEIIQTYLYSVSGEIYGMNISWLGMTDLHHCIKDTLYDGKYDF